MKREETYADGHGQLHIGHRESENVFRQRWQHDKQLRSTHGVNCTGSRRWNIYVTDGLVTWARLNLDYPPTGPDIPEFEPRGCPSGASFSWYIYSPLRVKYPYVRKKLLMLWREALENHDDAL